MSGCILRAGLLVILLAALAIAGPVNTAGAAKNHPPRFPANFKFAVSTEYKYDRYGVYAGITTITIKTPARDPDGDHLRYGWSATSVLSDGSLVPDRIENRRLSAKWDRDINYGELAAGTAKVTVRDGHGGRAKHVFEFELGAG